VAVSFSCTMDFDQVQTEKVNYEPVEGTGHGVLVSEEITETSSEGEAPQAGGVPGVESNVPSYPATTGSETKSESYTSTKNYEISSTHEIRTQAPGRVIRSSVGVIIDSTNRDVRQNERAEVEKLVVAAAGLNPAEGDSVTVSFMEFDTSLQQELAAEEKRLATAATRDLWVKILIGLGAFGIFIVVLTRFMRPLEKTFEIPGAPPVEEEVKPPTPIFPVADEAAMQRLQARERVEKLIREDPATAAKILRIWLKE